MDERKYFLENGKENGLASKNRRLMTAFMDIMCNGYSEIHGRFKHKKEAKTKIIEKLSHSIEKTPRLHHQTAVIDRTEAPKDKAIASASKWNENFNKDRRENRQKCMDLQNYTIQKPAPVREYKTSPTVERPSHYPLAIIPGQFSDYYEKFSSLQLACLPINTTLMDPKKLESHLAASQHALDSSKENESSDSDETGSCSTNSISESPSEDDFDDPQCRVCSQTPFMNRHKQPEKFVKCSTCKHQAHPSCIEMSSRMFVRSLAYKWQCAQCKTCCKCRKGRDDKMLYCVQCDRGFHIYCLALRNVPEGQFHCGNCKICSECGATSPEGHFNPSLTQLQRQDLEMIAQWNHKFVINPLTSLREHMASLCQPCYWKSQDKM